MAAHEQAAVALTDLSAQYEALLSKPNRTPAEEAQMKALEAKIESGNTDVSDFFRKTLYPELAQNAGTQAANALLSEEKSEVSRLQNTLADLGPHVIGIRLLLGDEHAYILVITPRSRQKYELKATPAELNDKVQQLRTELRSPSSDPKPHLAEMYSIVIAPLEAELAALERNPLDKGRVPTLLWSLDGAMRYLPMAALFDGHRYLAERFNNVLFTPESYGHMTAPDVNRTHLRVLAMGLSKSYGGLPALPGVIPELDAVVHDPADPQSHGPIDGTLLPNERFTWAALKAQLGPGAGYPVVHIASHFVLEAGSGTEPWLMLGGNDTGDPQGFPLTLSELENSVVSFHGTRLLTLSACSTAKGDTANDGLEMDSLGHGRPTKRRRSRARHAVGRERHQHQPHHERLLRALGQRSRNRQGRSPAPGPACFSPQLIRLRAFRNRPRRPGCPGARDPGHVLCSSLLLGALCPDR